MCLNPLNPFFGIFARYAEKIAMICEKSYTYSELYKQIESTQLREIQARSVVALVGDYSAEYITHLFALCAKKCIIAPILPKNMDFEMGKFGVEYILQNGQITQCKRESHTLLENLKSVNQSGLILFSSGSTGNPKAVVHNFDTMLESYANKAQNPTITISAFLPDHIAGIDVLLSVFGSGGTLIIPKSRNPQDILRTMQDYSVEILPASPTLLRLLLMSEIDKFDLSALKLVVYGSEKMPNSLLCALREKLPHTRFKQSFGTSETNAIKTKSLPNSDYFKFISVDYKIIDNELYLKSKTQSLGYLNADNSAFDSDGYFATGDLVESIHINGEEYLKILGRTKEIINVGGEKVLPQEVENVILEMPFIKDCLVYGESNAITGQSVSAKVVLEDSRITEFFGTDSPTNIEIKKELRKLCKGKLAPFKIPSKVERVESLEISERFKKIRKRG